MSIWTELLFLGGHVATPAALDALRGAAPDPAPTPAVPSRPAPARATAVDGPTATASP